MDSRSELNNLKIFEWYVFMVLENKQVPVLIVTFLNLKMPELHLKYPVYLLAGFQLSNTNNLF